MFGNIKGFKQIKNFYTRSQNCKKRLFVSPCLSVCPHGVTRLLLKKFQEILYVNIFENMSRKFKFTVLYKVLIIRPRTANIQREDVILKG